MTIRYAVLYSKTQDCFHVETLQEYRAKRDKLALEEENPFELLDVADDQEEATRIADRLRAKIGYQKNHTEPIHSEETMRDKYRL